MALDGLYFMAKPQPPKKTLSDQAPCSVVIPSLLGDIQQVIEAARKQTARAVNSTLVMMYWQIGKRIREDVLQNERAEYGKEVLQTLSVKLTEEYGRGFGQRNLEQMIRFAEVFPDNQIAQKVRGFGATVSRLHLNKAQGEIGFNTIQGCIIKTHR